MEIAWDEFRHSHKEADPNRTLNLCSETQIYHSDENHVEEVDTNFVDEFSSSVNDPSWEQSNDEDLMRVVNPRELHGIPGAPSLANLEAPVDNDETMLQGNDSCDFDLVKFVTDDTKSLRNPKFAYLIGEPTFFDRVEQDPNTISLLPEGMLVPGEYGDTVSLATPPETSNINEGLPDDVEEIQDGVSVLPDPAPSVPLHNAPDELRKRGRPRIPLKQTLNK